MTEAIDSPFRSTRPGVAHACGHDVHTAALLGAGLVLAGMSDDGVLDRRVRLIFQPAEETVPGGAQEVIRAGGIEGVHRIYGLHCDPRLDTGKVGLRVGALTAALFLKEFVPAGAQWAHFDIFCWQNAPKPGRPKGGDAVSLRAVWKVLKDRYAG